MSSIKLYFPCMVQCYVIGKQGGLSFQWIRLKMSCLRGIVSTAWSCMLRHTLTWHKL